MLIIVLIMITLFALLSYKIYIQRILKERSLQHKQEIAHQKKMLQQHIKVQESERERIATLLHDDVGNKLNILSVWINNPDSWNSLRSKEVISKQIPELINTTRNLSHSLYPVHLQQFGLILTIEALLANIESSLQTELILTHPFTPHEIDLEVQLYRIIQEFISNVIKHSGADRLYITIRDTNNKLALVLQDNGCGFNADSLSLGMGLKNISLRLKAINARHKWKSKSQEGCRLIIIIPSP